MLKIYEHLLVGPLACNCYIVGDPATAQAIVIDPGDDPEVILSALARHALTPVLTVATHAHFDHIMAADALRERTGAPFYLHGADVPLLDWVPASLELFLGRRTGTAPTADVELSDGDELKVGSIGLEVVHTPGHSPGSICLATAEEVFAGDTLFAQSIGRTDLPGGDTEALVTSVHRRLFPLGDLAVYPGHGPATSIDRERIENPFVGENARFWG